jgi:hypothetical protein
MRRAAVLAALVLLAPLAIPAASQAGTSGMQVPLDQSRRVPFSGSAASVIPGNPDLIYTNIVSPTDVRVVGRKLGVTNLVVLDSRGATLFDREIVVSAGDGSVVTVYRGGAATDYACAPYCTPAQGNPGLQPGQQPGGAGGAAPNAATAIPTAASGLAAASQALGGGSAGSPH